MTTPIHSIIDTVIDSNGYNVDATTNTTAGKLSDPPFKLDAPGSAITRDSEGNHVVDVAELVGGKLQSVRVSLHVHDMPAAKAIADDLSAKMKAAK